MLVRPMPLTTRSIADAAVVLLLEKAQQVDLVFVARRVVGVAAFGRVGRVAAAVPDEHGLAQAGSGGDQGAIADLAGVALAEGVDLIGGELGDAVAVGLEIVDEEDVVDAEVDRELVAVQGPGKVGEAQAAVAHRAGHAEAGRGYLVRAQKLFYDLFQAGVFLGRKALVAGVLKLSIDKVIQRQVSLGAAYVARQNHLSLSKTPQPSSFAGGKSAAAALSRIKVSIPLEGQIS